MSNSLAIYENFGQIQSAATALQQSGYFKDVTSQSQAIVKVMAGAELGLPPFASMAGIHIVQGKPVLGSNVIATLIKNDARYDYEIKTCTDKECSIQFYENGNKTGVVSFTMDEANRAGITGKPTWKAYPSDMLFARAISRGARRFAPGIFGGAPVYTPDEMNIDTDEEGYIQPEITQPETEPVTEAEITEVVQTETKQAPKPEGKPAPAKKQPASMKDAELFATETDSKGKLFKDMPIPELAGHVNEYIKRLKENPNDADTLAKKDACEYWIKQKAKK